MKLVLDATRAEYLDFLQNQYKDDMWVTPIQAWVMDYFKRVQTSFSPNSIVEGENDVSVSVGRSVEYDEYSADLWIELCLPEWIIPLWRYYQDRRETLNRQNQQGYIADVKGYIFVEWHITKEQALKHAQEKA